MASDHPTLISSVYGEIEAILLVYPGFATEQGDDEYADLVEVFEKKGDVYRFRKEAHDFRLALSNFRNRTLGEEQRFRQVFDLQPAMDIVKTLLAWRKELELVRKKGTMTFERWTQDPFLVLEWERLTILLNSLHNQRMCDFFLPLEVAQQMGPSFLVKPTRLYLEGGNVLCGEQAVLVGRDLVKKNVDELEIDGTMVLEALKGAFGGKRVISIGLQEETPCLEADGGAFRTTWQPLFHIDVFINLVGRGENGKETIFFGSPRACREALQKEDSQSIMRSEIEGRAFDMFQAARKELQGHDFEVIDIPIFFCDGTVFSWNNCLVEVTPSSKQVYLPSYQTSDSSDHEKLNATFKVLEETIEGIYEAFGFKVHWFRHGRFFRTIAAHGGSLHCIVKVMRRGRHSAGMRHSQIEHPNEQEGAKAIKP